MTFLKPLPGIATLFLPIVFVSCSRSVPVEEISVAASGLRVHPQQFWLSDMDWPGWRGPHGDGVAVDQPIVTQWDEQSHVLWKADVPGRGHSSPVVVGNRVVLTTALETEQEQIVLAFDRQSGEPLWSTPVHEGGFTSSRRMHPKSSHANSTVVSDGRRIFAAFLNQEHVFVTALDVKGTIVWQTDAGPFRSKFGYAPSPVVYQSCVIVAADHEGGGYLAALDRDTGKIVWRSRRPATSSYSSPLVAEVAGEMQLLICGCEQVASFDPGTGSLNWSCSGTAESTCGTAVSDGTHVFASGGYPGKETIAVRGDGSHDVAWRDRTGVYEPSLVLAGMHLFAVTDDGIAHCWDAASGQLQWRKRLGGSFSASPVFCRGLILVSNSKGETFVLRADGGKFEQVARNKLGDDCFASPTLSNGWIFIRVGIQQSGRRVERMYCIGDTGELSGAARRAEE